MTPKMRRHILQIIPFGVLWLAFSVIYILLERGLLGESTHYPSTGNPYDFSGSLFITAVASTITGLMVGTFEVLYLNRLFTRQSFGQKMVFKALIYIAIMITFLLALTITSNIQKLDANLFDKVLWDSIWMFLSNFAFWSVEIFIAAIILISLFYIEVSDNLGQGVLHNFFTGKYHQPVEEERIFMFLDMKSSTTFAEKLGHVRYFEMLKMYYSDLSDSIIEYAGEIYQYVGDEVVVSWKIDDGLQRNNCIRCFFAMRAALDSQEKKYLETFGLVPTFKAGFHSGNVTTGEIGVIKKDIIFTGDVLNTTARIQGLCNTYAVDILVSDHLVKKLDLDATFQLKALGQTELRGRDEKVELYTLVAS